MRALHREARDSIQFSRCGDGPSGSAGSLATRLLQDRRRGRLEAPPLRGQPRHRSAGCGRSPSPSRKSPANNSEERPAVCSRVERFNSRFDRRRDLDRVHVTVVRDEAPPCRPTSRPFGDPVRRECFRSLLRHQRSSPRGSFGASHSRSHRRLAAHRARSQCEIREQRPNLAGGGKLQGERRRARWSAGPASARKGRRRAVPGRWSGFHARFHAVSHVPQLPACSIIDWTASRFGRPRERRSVRHAELQNRQGGH